MSTSGAADQVITVPAQQWHQQVADQKAAGMTHFDSLHAIDEIGRPDPAHGEGEQLRVVVRLVNHDTGAAVRVQTRVPRPDAQGRGSQLDSVADLFAGAAWHEREAHDFFGIGFGDSELAPLLWHPSAQGPRHPLLKDEVLVVRATTAWPGAKDPEADGRGQASRRRTLPVGVPDPEVWQPGQDRSTLDAAEVAAAVSGGRVRRRR